MKKTQARKSALKSLKISEMKNTSSERRKSLYGKMCALYGAVVIALSAVGCKTPYYVPVEGGTTVRDSIRIETRIDTVEVQLPPIRVKDYSALEDTLHLNGVYETAWAYFDPDKELLVGEIKSTDVPLPTLVKYQDRIEYRDSIKTIPVPVEIPKEIEVIKIPWVYKLLSIFGIIGIVVFSIYAGFKIYGLKKNGFSILKKTRL